MSLCFALNNFCSFNGQKKNFNDFSKSNLNNIYNNKSLFCQNYFYEAVNIELIYKFLLTKVLLKSLNRPLIQL
jgi:hypothetical protein